MRKAKEISSDLFDGNFVGEVAPIYRGIRKDRRVELRCVICNTNFVVSAANAIRTRQKTCSNACAGTYRQSMEGGNLKHPLYNRWLSMRDRCSNPNNLRYMRYGGRGITYTSDFDEFNVYATYCTQLPDAPKNINETSMQIDRINNDMGYIQGNLRWASPATQGANKSSVKDASYTSLYVGVSYCKTNKRWIARVQYENKYLHQSSHLTEEAAWDARKTFLANKGLPHQI